ncbi:MAG TPA: mobile mystery protein A [Candidatus Paceibacterota bacterium]|nr:mobile mystery protein A [Candidatus Paceibacterota bacterium]
MQEAQVKRRTREKVRRSLDIRFKSLPPVATFAPPQQSWIRAIRESLGMSAADLGSRMGITPQSVLALEISESEGRVRVESLSRAAEAMDCTLVYTLIPRDGLESNVRRQAESVFEETMKKVSHSMKLESQQKAPDASTRQELVSELMNSGALWRASASRKSK